MTSFRSATITDHILLTEKEYTNCDMHIKYMTNKQKAMQQALSSLMRQTQC